MDNKRKEFWEWCGWEERRYEVRFGGPPQPKSGWYFDNKYKRESIPELTLYNLLKYALPKLESLGVTWELYSTIVKYKKVKFIARVAKLTIPAKSRWALSPHFIYRYSHPDYYECKTIEEALYSAIQEAIDKGYI